MLQTHGNSGGPILNSNGFVVGLTQEAAQAGSPSITSSVVYALDLARWSGGKPSMLCKGVALGVTSTVCGTNSDSPTPISTCWVTDAKTPMILGIGRAPRSSKFSSDPAAVLAGKRCEPFAEIRRSPSHRSAETRQVRLRTSRGQRVRTAFSVGPQTLERDWSARTLDIHHHASRADHSVATRST